MNRRGDSAKIVVDNHDKQPLVVGEQVLHNIANRWSGPVIVEVPGFQYWAVGDRRRMTRADNCTGHQQRAYDFYWQVREGIEKGGVCLGIGTTTVAGACTLGTDKHGRDNPPPDPRYQDTNETRAGAPAYSDPMFFMDANMRFPFSDNSFDAVLANHVVEHLADAFYTIGEMLRVCKPAGKVCIVMPDMTYSRRGSIDPTHTREFAADEFYTELERVRQALPPFLIYEHNTFDNEFSFNTTLQKK